MVTNQKLDEMSQKNTSKIICHNFGNAKTQINIFSLVSISATLLK